ncbi:HNH endonuclease [Vibrio neptunius]|uniref:HNH endonuclease n=1 Tax=Vibrio neptunius TaxID=170651 RepID=UPI003CE4AC34
MGGILDTDFTLIEALELTMDFVPVVSNLKAAYEFSTGKTIFGGIELEPLDRNLAAASIFLGPVAKVAVTVARHSDEAADLLTASSKVHDATKATDAALGGVDNIPLINGRKPINNKYAGKTHPSGVKFNEQGFPDFSPYSKAQVDIKGLTGDYTKDAAMANKAVGLKSTPDGYVWHHVENAKTMQLIPKDIHNAARHTGGAAVLRNQ